MIANAEAAPAVAQLILFPLLFISGTYTPIHSAALNRVAGWLPVRPFNEALTGLFTGQAGTDWRQLGVVAAWGGVGAIVAVRRFRWVPKPWDWRSGGLRAGQQEFSQQCGMHRSILGEQRRGRVGALAGADDDQRVPAGQPESGGGGGDGVGPAQDRDDGRPGPGPQPGAAERPPVPP